MKIAVIHIFGEADSCNAQVHVNNFLDDYTVFFFYNKKTAIKNCVTMLVKSIIWSCQHPLLYRISNPYSAEMLAHFSSVVFLSGFSPEEGVVDVQ